MGFIKPELEEPPHNLEVEASLLGAILRAPQTIDKIDGLLKPSDFYSPEHGRTFEIIINLYNRGVDIAPGRLKHIVDAHPELEEVGGFKYLLDLATNVVAIINVQDYAETIAELKVRRDLMEFADDLWTEANTLTDEFITSKELLDRVEQRFSHVVLREDVNHSSLRASANLSPGFLEKFLDEYENGVSRGLSTGFHALDDVLRGLFPADLVVVAGRPSMGKSAFALNLGIAAERQQKRVALFSPEMDEAQVIERLVSYYSEVPGTRIRNRDILDDEFEKVVDGFRKAEGSSFWIDESSLMTVAGIRREARRLKRRFGLDVIIIDYLQLLYGSDHAQRQGRVHEISELTRGLKMLAKELGIPIVLLSQLNRKVEEREDKRPTLADLRDSGSIEQDADVVTFLYRPEYYLREPEQKMDEAEGSYLARMADFDAFREKVRGVAEVIVAKNRHGPTATVALQFQADIGRFSS
jgi:replicative DNA helicase